MEIWYVIGSISLLVIVLTVLSEGGSKRHFRLDCLD